LCVRVESDYLTNAGLSKNEDKAKMPVEGKFDSHFVFTHLRTV